jgi:hypothetical protein
MDFAPILKESTIVMVSADPDGVSDQGLLPYELECPQILWWYIGVGTVDDVTVENKIIPCGKISDETVYEIRV